MNPIAAAVSAAMARADRRAFLPESQRPYAGIDGPLPIGHGQTNSQPSTVAAMLELLEPFPGMRVLDVGCGSGWTTALLALLAGETGTVDGVELVPELAEFARANLHPFALPGVRVHDAVPGVLGLPGEAPFDRILVSAMARDIPEALVRQLAPGGVMVAPWDGVMHRVRRAGRVTDREPDAPAEEHPDIEITAHGRYLFVPLL